MMFARRGAIDTYSIIEIIHRINSYTTFAQVHKRMRNYLQSETDFKCITDPYSSNHSLNYTVVKGHLCYFFTATYG